MPDCVYEGVPSYDAKGCYTGPLPSAKGHGAMFQRQAKGAFKTSGSEQWPAKLCQWLSAMLVSTCLHAANAAVGEGDHGQPAETLPPSSETFPLNQSEGPRMGAGRDGTPPFLPTARGGETFPRWGWAMLAWPMASPGQELCRWPPVGMAKEEDARTYPREGELPGTAREGGPSSWPLSEEGAAPIASRS